MCERLLQDGHEVTIVDCFDDFYDVRTKHRNIDAIVSTGRARLIPCDISDHDALDRALQDVEIDAIIHLAARAGVRPSIDKPLEYVRNNVYGTQSLLEIARHRDIRPVVFASSSSVYGESTPVPFRETEAASNPISPYAASKRAAELLCHAHAHLTGASVACLRLFTVYGPRQRPDLAIHKFARLMSRGEEIPFYGDGATARDYTYVDDAVNGIASALDFAVNSEPGTFEIINIGESVTTPLSRLVEMLATALGVTPRFRHLPHQAGDVRNTFADLTRARQLLGYEGTTSMEEGIRRFVAWFREQPTD